MKMIKRIFFALLLFFPISCLAISYDITDFKIEASVNNKGDMHVCETIVQDGNFNGYVRELEYEGNNSLYNGSNIANIEVFQLDPEDFTKKLVFTKVNSANNGESYKYIVTETSTGYDVKMYQKGGKVGYLLCYDVTDVAIKHQDYGELYWNFIGDQFADDLNNVEIRVYLPGVDENLRVWAHGPLSGYVNRKTVGVSYLEAVIEQVNAYQEVDVRMLFDKNLISDATKTTDKNIYDEVIKEETEKAEEANQERKKAQIIYRIEQVLFFCFFPITLFVIIYCYFKYDKEYSVTFDHEYLRDFPSEDGPEYVDYLFHHQIQNISYSATILEIIRKRALKIEKIPDKKEDYRLLKEDYVPIALTEEETMVRNFLIHTIGNGKEVILSDIKKYPKTESKARKWISHIDTWKNQVIKKAKTKNYYEMTKAWGIGIVYCIFAILVFLFGRPYEVWSGVFIGLIGILTIIYIFSIKKRTKEGALLYKKWLALKHFLEDFGRLDEKELPEITLWERYLVYATVFGIAKKVEKAMKMKIDQYHLDTSYDPVFPSYWFYSNLNTTITNTVIEAQQESYAEIARSSASSGSGFGGGFSGGAGGGGGGGGGHGF